MTAQERTSWLHYSPLDSTRFRRRIYRASLNKLDAPALSAALQNERVDTLILRIPADEAWRAADLYGVGLRPIFADTQVDYEIALTGEYAPYGGPAAEFVEVTNADSGTLRTIANEVFRGYVSHYRANPLFAAEAVTEGYADWAARHVSSQATPTWFVKLHGNIVGFACCAVEHDRVRGVLNGILPESRGMGCYSAMFHGMIARFRTAGLRRFAIKTQVHNVAVQRVWAAAGLRLRFAENTIHLNCDFGDAGDRNIESSAVSAQRKR